MNRQAREDLVLQALAGRRVGASGWKRACCPLCELRTGKVDRKFCLGLHTATGRWHCFKCQSSGHVSSAADENTRRPAPPPEEKRPEIVLPALLELWHDPGLTANVCQEARDYLAGRSIPPELIELARISYCVDGRVQVSEDRSINVGGRVVVPIFSAGVLVGWSARAIHPGMTPKYFTSPGMKRGEVLYNQDALTIETDEPVLIVEGVFDALPHLPHVVACLGKPTHQHYEAFLAARRPVAVSLDGDAWRESEVLAHRLRIDGQRAGSVRLPPGEDPGTMPRDWLRARALEVTR